MTKRLLILSVVMSMMLSVPVFVMAAEADWLQTEQTIDDDISITVDGQWVTINGAQGLTLEIVSLTGRQIKTIKIESPAQRIELNVPKGCYILKIGKLVRKVAIR
ncbi:MAG: T9SS type A sorting domain-containing protein [Prevotella sp.]|nr:T9SS type A sorting domain-containing protein [Prevotella sp.]